MAQTKPTFIIRTDPTLHAIVKREAAAKGISVNAYTQAALRWFVLLDEEEFVAERSK